MWWSSIKQLFDIPCRKFRYDKSFDIWYIEILSLNMSYKTSYRKFRYTTYRNFEPQHIYRISHRVFGMLATITEGSNFRHIESYRIERIFALHPFRRCRFGFADAILNETLRCIHDTRDAILNRTLRCIYDTRVECKTLVRSHLRARQTPTAEVIYMQVSFCRTVACTDTRDVG